MEKQTTSSIDRKSWFKPLRWAALLWIVFAVAVSVQMVRHPLERNVLNELAKGPMSWWSTDYFAYETNVDYVYTPTFSVFYTFFWILPPKIGSTLWTLFGLGILGWGSIRLLRDVLPTTWSDGQRAAFLGLTLIGNVRGLWSGQSNALIIGLAMFGIAAIARRKWWQAAWFLTLPIYIKVWPIALVMLIAPIWSRQLIRRVAIVALILAAVPWLTQKSDFVARQHVGYYDLIVGQRIGNRQPGYRDGLTLIREVRKLFLPTPQPTEKQLTIESPLPSASNYNFVQLSAAAMLFLWVMFHRRQREQTQIDSTFETSRKNLFLMSVLSLWASWELLFGPGSERLTLGILAPSLAWAVVQSAALRKQFSEQNRSRSIPAFAMIVSLTAYLCTYIVGSGEVERAIERNLLRLDEGAQKLAKVIGDPAHAIVPLGIVLFVIWMIVMHEVARRRSAELGEE
jgi:hypothetical protein